MGADGGGEVVSDRVGRVVADVLDDRAPTLSAPPAGRRGDGAGDVEDGAGDVDQRCQFAPAPVAAGVQG